MGFSNRMSEADVEGVLISEPFRYPSGSDQHFKQEGYVVSPALIEEDKLTYDPESDKTHYPLVIVMQSEDNQGRGAVYLVAMEISLALIILSQILVSSKHK